MDIHENARTTPRSRMLMIERLEAGSTVAAVACGFRCRRQDGAQVARPLSAGRRGRPGGPLVAAAFVALRGSMPRPKPRSRRCGASGSRDRRLRAASAGRSRRSARRCAGSGSAACTALDPRRAGHPLRAGAARRTDPHRFQEARQDRRHRPPHHRRPTRPEQQARHRLGSSAMSPSTTPPGSPTPKSCPTRRRRARPPSSSGRSASSSAMASRSSG